MEIVLLMVLIAVVSGLALWKVRAIMSRRAAKLREHFRTEYERQRARPFVLFRDLFDDLLVSVSIPKTQATTQVGAHA